MLARTDETVARHRGISMLIVDMRSPGVEVRPMTQITGHAEFCELFLDDVVVPEGEPPRRARRRLEDRHAHARPRARDGRAAAPGQAAHLARPRGARRRATRARRGADCSTTREAQVALARALIGIEVLRHHAYRTVGEFLNGGAVGPDSSSVKLLMAEAEQRLAATALEVLGPTLQHADPAEAAEDDFWTETYLYSRAASVYGGTQQIQRNIIADRILALPQE